MFVGLLLITPPQVTVDTVADMKRLIEALCDDFGGAAKIKNLFSLPDEAKAGRFHLLSVMLTVPLDSGLTFGGMATDPATQGAWQDYIDHPAGGEPRGRWQALATRARDHLASAEVADAPVMILGEVQILLQDFVDIRKQMHEPYRVWRASNAQQLHDDFARS